MRLDEPDAAACRRRGSLQRLDLLGDIGGDGHRVDRECPPTETIAVPIRHVSADRGAYGDGGRADNSHRLRVAGMKPAGDVGARHELEQRRIGVEPLPHVGVQIDDHDLAHDRTLRFDRCRVGAFHEPPP